MGHDELILKIKLEENGLTKERRASDCSVKLLFQLYAYIYMLSHSVNFTSHCESRSKKSESQWLREIPDMEFR